MNLSLLEKLLLLWSMQYVQSSSISAVTISRDDNLTSSNIILENQLDERSLQVESEITIDIDLGKATELYCGNETNSGLVARWQTPFGSFRARRFRTNDPFVITNGNLIILKATSSHTGLYHCHLVNSRGTTIIAYRVKVVDVTVQKTRMRISREVEANDEFLDSHLTAAVSSSVVVTFIVAFISGAFSQPYVIRCLRRTRGRMFPKHDDRLRAGAKKQSHLNVGFHRRPNLEDTVDFEESSTNIKSIPDTRVLDGSTETEQEIHTKQSKEAEAEADQAEAQAHKQLKRVSRVIKLYNYDEEGHQYGHIKDPETGPIPRQRVMSLTRLETIMNQMESLDLSTSTDTAKSEEPTNTLEE